MLLVGRISAFMTFGTLVSPGQQQLGPSWLR